MLLAIKKIFPIEFAYAILMKNGENLRLEEISHRKIIPRVLTLFFSQKLKSDFSKYKLSSYFVDLLC